MKYTHTGACTTRAYCTHNTCAYAHIMHKLKFHVKQWRMDRPMCSRAPLFLLDYACVVCVCIVIIKLLCRTTKAMGGSVTFRESLTTRLNMIKPSKQQLQDFIESQNIEDVLTPGVTYVKFNALSLSCKRFISLF